MSKTSPVAAHSHAVHKPLPSQKIRMNVVQLMQENGQCLMCFYAIILQHECNLEVEKIRLILGLKKKKKESSTVFWFVLLFYFTNGFGSKISE